MSFSMRSSHGAKELHSRDALVDAVARVKTAQRSVRKIPFLALKQKPWSIIFFL
jgi:hypothetical protein